MPRAKPKTKKGTTTKRVIPQRSILKLPAGWWIGGHPDGFRPDDWGDLAYLKCWGVTHVVWFGGRGKPKEIQTDEEAQGNHAWFQLCDELRAAGREKELDTAPTYPRARCGTLHMGSGGKGKPRRIIDNGIVKEYVGIGWIHLRPAKPKDYLKIPRLQD